jgi:hypothetical protein
MTTKECLEILKEDLKGWEDAIISGQNAVKHEGEDPRSFDFPHKERIVSGLKSAIQTLSRIDEGRIEKVMKDCRDILCDKCQEGRGSGLCGLWQLRGHCIAEHIDEKDLAKAIVKELGGE